MHYTWNVRIPRCCRRSQVSEGLACQVAMLIDTQWNHEDYRDSSSHHVRADRSSDVHPSDYGKK